MQIIQYESELAESVATFLNAQTAGVPFTWPVSAEQLDRALSKPLTLNDSSDRTMVDPTVFVLREAGNVAGFATVGVEEHTGAQSTGAIGFLLYKRGNRRAGQVLLDAAHEHIDRRTPGPVDAFHQRHRLPVYHFAHSYCSDGLDHVQALLAVNGYSREGGEVFLVWDRFEPTDPGPHSLPVELRVKWIDGQAALPGLVVEALLDGERIGECRHCCGGDLSDHPDADGIAFCMWLGINDTYQGRGLGAYLLQRSLAELKARGYEVAAISTAHDNHRAFLFYSNYGYRTADWTYGFRRPAIG